MLLLCPLLAAAPAAAQLVDYGLREDSLPVAADAEPLSIERVRETECDPFGLRVVRDTAELRTVQHFRACDATAFPGLGTALYVHVSMIGDCHARLWPEAFRSDSRREYRIVMMEEPGECRAARYESYWLRLPPLPDGWTVGFTSRVVPPAANHRPPPRRPLPEGDGNGDPHTGPSANGVNENGSASPTPLMP